MDIKKIFLSILIIGIFAGTFVFAQDDFRGKGYILLEKLPSIGKAPTISSTNNISDYLSWVFIFGISLAGIFSVLQIVIGGIQYITAYGNPSAIENAKDRITQALLGLLLVVSAWLILWTINPDLIKGTLNIPPIK